MINRLQIIIIISFIFQYACSPSFYIHPDWSNWKKIPDNPGIQCRVICLGPAFEGSRFYKWEVEVFNDYSEPVSFVLTLSNGFSGKESSEKRTAVVAPNNVRKLVFYNVAINCEQTYVTQFDDVQFMP